jgi:hypothetical protein
MSSTPPHHSTWQFIEPKFDKLLAQLLVPAPSDALPAAQY